MTNLGTIFKRGLWNLFALMITLAVLGLMYNFCEHGWYGQAMRSLAALVLPASIYNWFPGAAGISTITTVILIFLLGCISSTHSGSYVLKQVHHVLASIPVFRTFYGPAHNVCEIFLNDDPKSQKLTFQRVVKIPWAPGIWAYALVTGEEIRNGVKYLDVFLPHAPTFSSGFPFEVEEAVTEPVPWSIEVAFRFIVSCGILKPPPPAEPPLP
jgi:uncharacterized membrane protein